MKRKQSAEATEFEKSKKALQDDSQKEKTPKNTQTTIFQFCKSKKVTQDAASKAIVSLVVKCGLTLSLVEAEPFQQLVSTMSSGTCKSISRKSPNAKIDNQFEAVMINIKKALSSKDYVCTTADIWSQRKKSFLGMTAYVVDPETLRETPLQLLAKGFQGHIHLIQLLKKFKKFVIKLVLITKKLLVP